MLLHVLVKKGQWRRFFSKDEGMKNASAGAAIVVSTILSASSTWNLFISPRRDLHDI